MLPIGAVGASLWASQNAIFGKNGQKLITAFWHARLGGDGGHLCACQRNSANIPISLFIKRHISQKLLSLMRPSCLYGGAPSSPSITLERKITFIMSPAKVTYTLCVLNLINLIPETHTRLNNQSKLVI
eukprot:sb/3475318/